VAAAGGPGGNLFRSSGVVYSVDADGMLHTLGLVSGKDVARPALFLPVGARQAELIGVAGVVYAATSQGCGGAPNAIWAIDVVSWKTNGGNPIGSPAFAASGTLIAAIGPGTTTAGGLANAIVALDPKTLALKDWFTQPGVEFAAPPVVFQEAGKDIVAATTRDGRVLLLDAASLGGADHSAPLFASAALTGAAGISAHPPAMWQERSTTPTPSVAPGAAPQGPAVFSGTRWLLLPVSGRLQAPSAALSNGTVSTGAILAVSVSENGGRFSVRPGWVSENIASPLTPIVVTGAALRAQRHDGKNPVAERSNHHRAGVGPELLDRIGPRVRRCARRDGLRLRVRHGAEVGAAS
jgi:hypothetical protein